VKQRPLVISKWTFRHSLRESKESPDRFSIKSYFHNRYRPHGFWSIPVEPLEKYSQVPVLVRCLTIEVADVSLQALPHLFSVFIAQILNKAGIG
jgi:hypothetical protein